MAGPRRLSTSSNSRPSMARVPSASLLAAALAKVFPRRTYSSSKVRTFALLALGAVSLVASTMVLHAWLFAAPSAHHIAAYHARQHAHLARQGHDRRPASRAFRYPSADSPRPRRTTDATPQTAYSFAQHAEYELGALVAFMAALASNSLPGSVDPAGHIDPELVLGFDTRAGDAKVHEEVETIVADTWARNPVVVFSELRSTAAPASREVKTILDTFRLYPEPTVFEVDQRVDADVLRPLLRRLTGAETLPAVLINGQPLRSLAEVRAARDDGRLRAMLDASAATVDGALDKKKKKH